MLVNKKFWIRVLLVVSMAQAILAFGSTGIVGAGLSGITILACGAIIFDFLSAKLKDVKAHAEMLAQAQSLLQEAAEELEEAKDAFLMDASPENKAQLLRVKSNYVAAKKHVAELKKKGCK